MLIKFFNISLFTCTCSKLELSLTPANFKMSVSFTPVHVALPIAPGPQFNPLTSLYCNNNHLTGTIAQLVIPIKPLPYHFSYYQHTL